MEPEERTERVAVQKLKKKKSEETEDSSES